MRRGSRATRLRALPRRLPRAGRGRDLRAVRRAGRGAVAGRFALPGRASQASYVVGGSSRRASSSSRPWSSSRRSSGGKKAGAGLGAAATAAAGGIGALSSGGEDAGAESPDPGYPEYSNHSDYYGSSPDPYDDPSAVVDEVPVPIVSFKVQRGSRLVVVTGMWPDSWLPGGCQVEITATERSARVVLEASAPVTRQQSRLASTCDPPASWSTATSYVQLVEPLGKRTVVTSGALLRGGEEVDADAVVRVPRG